MIPEYIEAAKALGEQDPPRYIAKVDAVEYKDLADKHDVKGFPTLMLF